MIKLNKNQILIKSFSYDEEIEISKKKIEKQIKCFKIQELEEKITEVKVVERTHAIIYLIDQNRFWYFNILDNEVIESHHTKNGLFMSVKIIDEMRNRFSSLNETEITDYSIFTSVDNIEKLDLIERYTNLEVR